MNRRQFLGSTVAGLGLLAASHVMAQDKGTTAKPDLMEPGPLPERVLGRVDAPVTDEVRQRRPIAQGIADRQRHRRLRRHLRQGLAHPGLQFR